MVEHWNEKVKKNKDIVYVLGDVAMNKDSLKWLDLMNGQKRLILGNHDTFHYDVYREHFKEVMHFHKAYHGLVLTHIPIHPNELEYRNWSHNIHGHIHDPLKSDLGDKYFNVNVDVIGYQPISLEELRDELK